MNVKANAKINLTLDIVGKRDDGYHLIDSIFQSVSLCDELKIEKSSVTTVACSDNTICDESNIAYKAAQKFFEYTGVCGGVSITIKKNIPLASGMGGGSADAAAVIVACDKLYKTNLSQEKLCKIGLSVGADVPFCIVGGTARVGGVGEKINKITNMPECAILLIKQGNKLSTADMYKKIDCCLQKSFYTDSVANGIKNGDLNTVCKNVFNAFSTVCDNDKIVNDIKKTNPLAVSLSGSGPTIFSIYSNTVAANSALSLLKKMGYSPIFTTPNTKGIVFE